VAGKHVDLMLGTGPATKPSIVLDFIAAGLEKTREPPLERRTFLGR